MKDYAVEFGFKGSSVSLGIVPDTVDADIDFPKSSGSGRQIESDDVCVIVMLQVLAVNPEQSIVAAEDIIEGLQFFSFLPEQGCDLCFKVRPFFQGKTLGFEEETNF